MNCIWSALLTALFLFSQFLVIAQNVITITDGSLNSDTTYQWTNENVYLLQGDVFLEANGVLRIEPGTLIRGQDEKAALIITPNAQIFAEGTENQPIIFTDLNDDLCDPNDLAAEDVGLWKGLFILGNASQTDTNCLSFMPGLPLGDNRAVFGANGCDFNSEHDAGILQYISIRHSSFGLSLGAVGISTDIDHVESFASNFGISIYGGEVNLKYMVASLSRQSSFYWNNGWQGNGQFWFGIMSPSAIDNGGTHHGKDLPNNGPTSNPTIYNATYIGAGVESLQGSNEALVFNNNSAGKYLNSIFTEFRDFGLVVEDQIDGGDSYEQMLNNNLVLANNLWWDFGQGNQINAGANGFIGIPGVAGDPTAQALITHLLENNNDAQNPDISNISREQDGTLDPRPLSDGAAYGNVAGTPDDPFFESPGHRGAFDTKLWISNWTALDNNNYLVSDNEIDCNLIVTFEKTDINCHGDNNGTINLNVSGGNETYFFDWEFDLFDGQQSLNGLSGGTYNVTISDINCCEVEQSIEILEPAPLSFDDCGAITLQDDGEFFSVIGIGLSGGTPNYSVSYSSLNTNGIVVIDPIGQGQTPSLPEGDYQLVVTDNNGCIDTCSTTVEPLCNLVVNAIVQPITCNGADDGGINLSFLGGTPPLTFDWSDDDFDSIEDPNGLAPGTYTVTVTDNNNCADTVSVTLNESPPLVLPCDGIDIQHISSFGASDGRITATFSGGDPGYNVYIYGPVNSDFDTDGGTGAIFDNLPEGAYTLSVTDARNCIQSCNVIIEGCNLNFKSISTTDPTCNGFTDGAINIQMTNAGNTPLNIDWSINALDGQLNPTGLAAGTYDVTVTDANNCSVNTSIILNNPAELTLSTAVVFDDRSEEADNGEIEASVFGGSPPYTLSWTTLSGDSDSRNIPAPGITTLDGLSAGIYSFSLQDSKACAVTGVDTVESVFVVEAGEEFILEFFETASLNFIDSVRQEITSKATLIDTCNCSTGISYIQLWGSNDRIEINTSGEGEKSKVRTDTSGLGRILILNPDTTVQDSNLFCIASTGHGPKSDTIKIAVIDSGMDLKTEHNTNGHPLLSNINWINPLELADNKFDDDQNCLDDDIYGYDILNDTPRVIDKDGHGTHIAGIIADSFPNDIQLELMNLKIYEQGEGSVFDLICAIHYAINNNADVINLSLGYFNERPSKTLFNALKRAEEKDIMVIISAGNDTLDLETSNTMPENNRWPGKFKLFKQDTTYRPLTNLMVVAALDSTKEALDLSYSNFGAAHVDIATEGIFTSTYLNHGERTLKGTSMSAAYVTRLAAIAKAKRPDLSPRGIIQCIKSQATPLKNPNNVSPRAKLNPNGTLECLGISPDSIIYDVPEFPDGRGAITYSSVQFRDDLTITLGNGQTFYNDVELAITDGNNTLHTLFYCATNIITWDGTDGNGYVFPSGPYFIKLKVGSRSFSAQKVIKM